MRIGIGPFAVGGMALLVAAGCASAPKKAILASPRLSEVSTVALLPVVDARRVKEESIDLEEDLRKPVSDALESRGYKLQVENSAGPVGAISDVDLKSPEAAWIRKLGPPNARYTVVVMLVDVKSTLTFGSTGNAEISGYLFDRQEGTLLWRDKGVAQVGQGGLFGMAMKGSMAASALKEAAKDMARSLPERE